MIFLSVFLTIFLLFCFGLWLQPRLKIAKAIKSPAAFKFPPRIRLTPLYNWFKLQPINTKANSTKEELEVKELNPRVCFKINSQPPVNTYEIRTTRANSDFLLSPIFLNQEQTLQEKPSMKYLLCLVAILIALLFLFEFIPSLPRETDFPHKEFHRAIYLAEKLPKLPEKQVLIQIGSICAVVVSGLHFQWALGFFKKLGARGIFLKLLCIGLGFLWQWNIPVTRAFFHTFFGLLPEAQKIRDPFLKALLSFGLCIPLVNNIYDFHSLWLSMIFTCIFSFKFDQGSLLKKIIFALAVFLISPFILPFPSKLHIFSVLSTLVFLFYFGIFLFLSPLLHLFPGDICPRLYRYLFNQLELLIENFPIYHPHLEGGSNLSLLLFLFLFTGWRVNICCKRYAFFSSQSQSQA